MAKSATHYEAMVILSPLLDDEERNDLIEKLSKVLIDGGAELTELALWGRRRLAKPIQKKEEGFYVIFYFVLATIGQTLDQFEHLCRFDENIFRNMVITLPTHKKGREIKPIVPAPGWLADFRFERRGMGGRRRYEGSAAAGGRSSPPARPAAPAAPAAATAEAAGAVEAPSSVTPAAPAAPAAATAEAAGAAEAPSPVTSAATPAPSVDAPKPEESLIPAPATVPAPEQQAPPSEETKPEQGETMRGATVEASESTPAQAAEAAPASAEDRT